MGCKQSTPARARPSALTSEKACDVMLVEPSLGVVRKGLLYFTKSSMKFITNMPAEEEFSWKLHDIEHSHEDGGKFYFSGTEDGSARPQDWEVIAANNESIAIKRHLDSALEARKKMSADDEEFSDDSDRRARSINLSERTASHSSSKNAQSRTTSLESRFNTSNKPSHKGKTTSSAATQKAAPYDWDAVDSCIDSECASTAQQHSTPGSRANSPSDLANGHSTPRNTSPSQLATEWSPDALLRRVNSTDTDTSSTKPSSNGGTTIVASAHFPYETEGEDADAALVNSWIGIGKEWGLLAPLETSAEKNASARKLSTKPRTISTPPLSTTPNMLTMTPRHGPASHSSDGGYIPLVINSQANAQSATLKNYHGQSGVPENIKHARIANYARTKLTKSGSGKCHAEFAGDVLPATGLSPLISRESSRASLAPTTSRSATTSPITIHRGLSFSSTRSSSSSLEEHAKPPSSTHLAPISRPHHLRNGVTSMHGHDSNKSIEYQTGEASSCSASTAVLNEKSQHQRHPSPPPTTGGGMDASAQQATEAAPPVGLPSLFVTSPSSENIKKGVTGSTASRGATSPISSGTATPSVSRSPRPSTGDQRSRRSSRSRGSTKHATLVSMVTL